MALETWGRLDGALISVGGPPAGSVADTTEDQWRSAFQSVFLAGLRVNDAVVRHGTAPDLAIAWVLSTSAKSPVAGLAASNGFRPGLAMLIKQLADELGPRGVRVLGLMPGRVETERVQHLDSLADDPQAARSRPRRPSRSAATGSRTSSPGWPRSCCRPRPPTSPGVDPDRGRRAPNSLTDSDPRPGWTSTCCSARCADGDPSPGGRRVGCPNGHAFDVARQGYLNLLGASPPANADTTAMVAARAEFLASGTTRSSPTPWPRRCRLRPDGAGLRRGHRLLPEPGAAGDPHRRGFALDVSVPAVRRAARAHPRVTAVVADAGSRCRSPTHPWTWS